MSLGVVAGPLRDSVIGNNDDLVPALAQRLLIRFPLRGRLIPLLILLVHLVWALPIIVRGELDTMLVDKLVFIVTGIGAVVLPVASIVVGIIPAISIATSIVVGIIPAEEPALRLIVIIA